MSKIALMLAGALAVCSPASLGQQSGGHGEVGWLGLFNRSLVEWLENQQQVQRLCSAFPAESAEWHQCRSQKLSPRIHVVQLRTGPSETAVVRGGA